MNALFLSRHAARKRLHLFTTLRSLTSSSSSSQSPPAATTFPSHDFDTLKRHYLDLAKKDAEQNAPSRSTTHPYKRLERDSLVAKYLDDLREENLAKARNTNTSTSTSECVITFLTQHKHACKRSLKQLEPMLIRDMRVPWVHHGRRLVCRLLFNGSKSGAMIEALVEDANGDAIVLYLNNMLTSAEQDPPAELKQGCVLVIKEPYVRAVRRVTMEFDFVVVQCDTPTDIEFVDEDNADLLQEMPHGWIQKTSEEMSPSEMEKKCDEFLSSKEYKSALKVLNRVKDLAPHLRLKRSLINMHLSRYEDAYTEAEQVAHASTGKDKQAALLQLGCIKYATKQWEQAFMHFNELHKQDENIKELKEWMDKTVQRLHEQFDGAYDLEGLYKAAETSHDLDVADYAGPIQVVDIKGKGKGIVATKDIKPGTIVIGSKAFALARSSQKHGVFAASLERNDFLHQTEIFLIAKTINNLRANPHRAHELEQLYAGPNATEPVMCEKSGAIDPGRLEMLCLYNMRAFSPDECGLWLLPSMLNHSCEPNAVVCLVGDVLFVCPSREVRKGEELLIPYCNTDLPYEQRREYLQQRYKFVCECEKCQRKN